MTEKQVEHDLINTLVGWVKELALMEELMPQLKKLAQGRDIAGLAAYE